MQPERFSQEFLLDIHSRIHNFEKYPEYARPSSLKAYVKVVGDAMRVVTLCYKIAFNECKETQKELTKRLFQGF
jgi:hypothetical protein